MALGVAASRRKTRLGEGLPSTSGWLPRRRPGEEEGGTSFEPGRRSNHTLRSSHSRRRVRRIRSTGRLHGRTLTPRAEDGQDVERLAEKSAAETAESARVVLAATRTDLDTADLDVEAAMTGETAAHDRYRDAEARVASKVTDGS
jgi:hypothetical protein